MNLQPASTFLHTEATSTMLVMPPRDIPLEIILPPVLSGNNEDLKEVPQFMELTPGNYWEVIQSKWEQEEDDEQEEPDIPPVSEVVVPGGGESESKSLRRGRRGSLVMTLKKTIMHPEDTARLKESVASPSQPYMPYRKESMGMASFLTGEEEEEDEDYYDSDYDDDDESTRLPRRGSLGVRKAYYHRKASMGMASVVESEEDYYDTEDEEDEDEQPAITTTIRPSGASNLAPIPPFRRGSLVMNMAHLLPSSSSDSAEVDGSEQQQRSGATTRTTPRRGSLVMSLGYEVAEPTLGLRRQVTAPPTIPYRKPSMGQSPASSTSPKYPTRKSSMEHVMVAGTTAPTTPSISGGDQLQIPYRKPSMDILSMSSSSSSTPSTSTTTTHHYAHPHNSPKRPNRKASMDHHPNSSSSSSNTTTTHHSRSTSPTYPTRKPSMDHHHHNHHNQQIITTTTTRSHHRRGSLIWSVAPEEPEHIRLKLTGF